MYNSTRVELETVNQSPHPVSILTVFILCATKFCLISSCFSSYFHSFIHSFLPLVPFDSHNGLHHVQLQFHPHHPTHSAYHYPSSLPTSWLSSCQSFPGNFSDQLLSNTAFSKCQCILYLLGFCQFMRHLYSNYFL